MPTQRTVAPLRAISCLALAGLAGATACGSDPGPTGPTSDPPSITTTTLPDGRVDQPYSAGVDASDGEGEYAWDVIGGALPPGLELSVEDLTDDDLVITGTPETQGTFSFDLRLRDEADRADTASLTIAIGPPPGPLAITTPAVPPALQDAAYRVELMAEGIAAADATWTVVAGSLPPGLTLGSDGQFSGVPTATGTFTFTVEATNGTDTDTREYDLTVVQERTNRFDITPFAVVDVPPSLQDNVAEAIARWEAAITGDLTAFSVAAGDFGPGSCGGFGQLVNGTTLDDMIMMINIDSIDGPGEVLGQAGPCFVRNSNDLPLLGILTLDEDDLITTFETEVTTTDIIQHEMGHILGFGTLWTRFDLLDTTDEDDPRYMGEEAIAEYQAAGGSDPSIPVENTGGDGTENAHWRETVFDEELMTGFSESDGVDMVLSRMTIASYADLGYIVDLTAADAVVVARWVTGTGADGRHSLGHIGYDIAGYGPVVAVDDRSATLDDSTGGTRP